MNKELALSIAANLEGNWTVEDFTDACNDRFYLVAENGMKLFIRPAYLNDKMFSVYLSIPRVDDVGNISKYGREIRLYKEHGPGNEEAPSMNVGITKTPEKIAQNIQTRIMSECVRIHEYAMKKVAEMQEYYNSRHNALEQLKDAFGDAASMPKKGHHTMAFKNGHLIINDVFKSVDFKLNDIPLATALKLAQYLKENILV